MGCGRGARVDPRIISLAFDRTVRRDDLDMGHLFPGPLDARPAYPVTLSGVLHFVGNLRTSGQLHRDKSLGFIKLGLFLRVREQFIRPPLEGLPPGDLLRQHVPLLEALLVERIFEPAAVRPDI